MTDASTPSGPPTLLLDFDGTIADSGGGILASIEHALARLERPIPPREELRRFIGPPLARTFAELLGTENSATLDGAIELYRELYRTEGIANTDLYDGVPEALGALRERGYRLHVASSKPHVFVRAIAERCGVADRFESIGGSELDGRRTDKAELIGHLLTEHGLDRGHVWMIGDREHDVIGARAHDLPALGVLWGYGSREELEGAGADAVVATPDELAAFGFPIIGPGGG